MVSLAIGMVRNLNTRSRHLAKAFSTTSLRLKSQDGEATKESQDVDPKSYFYPNTSVGIKERSIKAEGQPDKPLQTPYPQFPDGKNPKTGEVGGPVGPEPTRFGDWERKGRVTDF